MNIFVDNLFGMFFMPQVAKENTFLNKKDKFTVAAFLWPSENLAFEFSKNF
jgi:hypothetical protein